MLPNLNMLSTLGSRVSCLYECSECKFLHSHCCEFLHLGHKAFEVLSLHVAVEIFAATPSLAYHEVVLDCA